MWHTKNAFFREMQFWSHCYTVVSYQALYRLSVYKIPAVYLSGAKMCVFCTIRDFGSPPNGILSAQYVVLVIPLFHTGPESHELTRIDKYLDSWLNRTQFVKILTDSHSP